MPIFITYHLYIPLAYQTQLQSIWLMDKKQKQAKKMAPKKDEGARAQSERNDSGSEMVPKQLVKPKVQKVKKYIDQSSESSASSSSQSESQLQYSRRSGRKKIPKEIEQFIDDEASSQSGEQLSSLDTDREQQLREAEQNYKRVYKTREKRGTEVMLENLKGKTQEQINSHYRNMLKQIDAREQHKMMDGYKQRHEKDLYQVKCAKGHELALVSGILNKAKYADGHPGHFFCQLVSALALPKKFPGFVFLEGKSAEDIRKSVENFTGLNLGSIKKIEFEIFAHLFDERYVPINNFKVEQYVRVKVGAYKDDVGQITKLNNRSAVVQLIPRISFPLINLRMSEHDATVLGKNYNLVEIMKIKNQILKRLTNPRVTYKSHEWPAKKKLSQADFFIYNEFPHNKNIKITEDGLILATYAFNEIECPKTTISPQEILELNPPTDNPGDFLKEQAKNIKMEFDIRPNELVQIVGGELAGITGRVYECTSKIVRIMCLNSDIKGLVIDELHQNLQKKFKEGERVVVIEGSNKGEQGMVYRNGSDTVSILTDNNLKIECLKRNVQTQMQARVSFANDLGIKADNLICVRGVLGVVSGVKKMYVDYVNTSNQLCRAGNGEFDLIANGNHKSLTGDGKQVERNCLVQIRSGPKKEKVMRVKHVYKGFLFLHDAETIELGRNWVESSDNCYIYVRNAPRIEAQYLNPTNWHTGFNRFRNTPNNPTPTTTQQNDQFKVGNPFLIVQGVYKGVKGVIVSSFKDHIEVRVLRDKIVSIPREALGRREDEFDRRSVADSVASRFASARKRTDQ